MPIARITRPAAGGNPDGSGGGAGGSPRNGGASFALSEVRSRVSLRQLLRRRPVAAGEQRAHLLEAGVDEVLGVLEPACGGEPAAGGQRGAAHDPGRPDVAVDAALVADLVGQPRLVEQLVELRPMLLGHLARGPPATRSSTSASAGRSPAMRDADGPQQRVGQLERVATGDVEAVEQPVADQVQVRRRRRAHLAVARAQRVEDAAGIGVGREQLLRGRVGRHRGPQPLELVGGARRDGRGAAQQAEQLGRREPGPVADVREEVARRDRRRGREAHVLEDHLGVVVAAAREVLDQLAVRQRVGIDRLELAVLADRRRLGALVPLAQLLAPQLALEHLLGPLEARRELVLRQRDVRACRRSRRGTRTRACRRAARRSASAPRKPRLNGAGCISAQ